MAVKRGTSNSNSRGSAKSRRRRKEWILGEFGDGIEAPCCFCGKMVNFDTVSIDRIIPGCEGGTYKRGNIRPACGTCNSADGGRLGAARREAKSISLATAHVVV